MRDYTGEYRYFCYCIKPDRKGSKVTVVIGRVFSNRHRGRAIPLLEDGLPVARWYWPSSLRADVARALPRPRAPTCARARRLSRPDLTCNCGWTGGLLFASLQTGNCLVG